VSASALTLHVLAHRAGARHRDAEDWWGSAIETALAGVSASRHPPAHREQAERALERVQRWRRTGQARPVSADAVALALAARTAATLALADRNLLSAAIEAVDARAARGPAIVPELHLALAAWALDDLVVDRDQAPWPGLRTRLDRGTVYGVDDGLRSYAAAVAARRFDPRALVQDLIARVPASPTVADGSVVLWLLGVAVDRVTRSMPSDEPGLNALVERRAVLTERLAVELDEGAFRTPHVDEFDPQTVLRTPHRSTCHRWRHCCSTSRSRPPIPSRLGSPSRRLRRCSDAEPPRNAITLRASAADAPSHSRRPP
jgi:hypothetical protein